MLSGKPKTFVSPSDDFLPEYALFDQNGKVYSYNVANLQFALAGRGSISRSQNEGVFNRIIKYLF